jgi:PE family
MSYVTAVPEAIQGAAQNLAGIRDSLARAVATAGPTTGIAAAAEDEISVALAALFGSAGQQFQLASAQAQAFHAEFETLLSGGAAAYVAAEAANAGQLLTDAANGISVAAPAAAVPAQVTQTFDLLGGLLDVEIEQTGGILVTIGTPGINLPAVHVPPINLSAFSLPQITIPPINIPAGTTPANVMLSGFNLPQITIPSINIPAGSTPPGVTVGSFSLPQITTPTIAVPPITLPAVTVPGFNLPSIGVPTIGFPSIQFPDLDVMGNNQTLVTIGGLGPLLPGPITVNLENFDIVASLGLNTPGYINAFNIPPITVGGFTVPPIGLSGFNIPGLTIPPINLGQFTLPQVSWPGFATAPLTIPPIGVGNFTLPQLSWPGFATPPLTIPPIGLGAFSLPDVLVPNIAIEPLVIGQFQIPPATSYLSTAAASVNAFISELEFIGSSLTGVGTT